MYKFCFAAGTLVHTDKGLVPIEKVRVGTQVLSQPEQGGERAWRPVINTVAHLDQQVYAVQVKVQGANTLTTLIATPNHPFWVESPLVDGQHWMAAECLEPGFVLQLADGSQARVHAAGLIRRTQHEHIAFAADDRAGLDIVLEIGGGQIRLLENALALGLGTLRLGEPYLTPVYNFEVDGFHTYYVGETGVWVHNTECTKAEALDAARLKAEIEGQCFPGRVLVQSFGGSENNDGFYPDVRQDYGYKPGDGTYSSSMELMEVGEYVLSRCEITGETAYKRVTKVFNHGSKKVSVILCKYSPEFYQRYPCPQSLMATEEHPFWVEGKGWTKVRDLQPGDEFVTYNGAKATCMGVELDDFTDDVFNLEVEDFHTYFVGFAGVWVHNKSPIDFNRLNNKEVDNPKPEWSVLHKSEADLLALQATSEAGAIVAAKGTVREAIVQRMFYAG